MSEAPLIQILRSRPEPENACGCIGRSFEGMARCLKCGSLHKGEEYCRCCNKERL